MMNRVIVACLVALSASVDRGAGAQAAGELNLDFNPGIGSDGLVYTLAEQSNRHIIIGGHFSNVQGTPRNHLARLRPDGSVDPTFAPGITGPNAQLNVVLLQADGRLLIGGGFTQVNGVSRAALARLHTDGTLDQSFEPQWGVEGQVSSELDSPVPVGGAPVRPIWVNAIAVLPDGAMIVAGDFAQYAGVPRSGLVKIRENGALDSTFHPGLGVDTGFLSTLLVQPDGRLLVGGYFATFNGTPRDSLVRLNPDGSVDNTFIATEALRVAGRSGPEFDGVDLLAVYTLALQNNGRILVGGTAPAPPLSAEHRACGILRLHRDGRLDSAFDAGTGVQLTGARNPSVWSLWPQLDGKTLIAGDFEGYDGHPARSIARVHLDGSFDRAFQIGTGVAGGNSQVNQIIKSSSGGFTFVGDFEAYNGFTRRHVAQIVGDPPTAPVITGQSASQAALKGTDVQLFVATSDRPPPAFQWHRGGEPIHGATNATLVMRQVSASRGGEYFCRAQNTLGSTRSEPIFLQIKAAQPGMWDATFDAGSGVNRGSKPAPPEIRSLALQADGKALVAGSFHNFNGTPRNGLARLNRDGSVDNTFDPGTGVADSVGRAAIDLIQILGDQRIVIAGEFKSYNQQEAQLIAVLSPDGTRDPRFRFGSTNDLVWINQLNALAVQADGSLLLAGDLEYSFLPAGGGLPRLFKDLIRIRPNGELDESFDAADVITATAAVIRSMAVQPDGKILIGGRLSVFRPELGETFDGIARLNADGTFDPSFKPFEPGLAGNQALFLEVDALAVQSDKVLVAGVAARSNGLPGIGRVVMRVHANGEQDRSFPPFWIDGSPLPEERIRCIKLDLDGKILVAGTFTTADATGLIRLNSDGSPELSIGSIFLAPLTQLAESPTPPNFQLKVHDVALQPDQRILLIGDIDAGAPLNLEGPIEKLHDAGVFRLHGGPGQPEAPSFADTPIHELQGQPSPEFVIRATVAGFPPPSLQWQRNGLDLPHETRPSLSLGAGMPPDGMYRLIARNDYGSAISPPVRIASLQLGRPDGGVFTPTWIMIQSAYVTWSGPRLMVDADTTTEHTDRLDGSLWRKLPRLSNDIHPIVTWIDRSPDAVNRFYRINGIRIEGAGGD